jgi:hypothetical protein
MTAPMSQGLEAVMSVSSEELGSCLMRAITVEVAELLTGLRAQGPEKTLAGALATLHSIVRFAIRKRLDHREPRGEAGGR